jgi:hypothetical protein
MAIEDEITGRLAAIGACDRKDGSILLPSATFLVGGRWKLTLTPPTPFPCRWLPRVREVSDHAGSGRR